MNDAQEFRTRLFAVRGATGAENTRESIQKNTVEMCSRIFKENALSSDDIVSIQFTLTKDLDAMNPASALRKGDCGIDVSRIPLFCSQEPDIKGSPEKIIRVLVTAYLEEDSSARHVYINGAERIRPDFVSK